RVAPADRIHDRVRARSQPADRESCRRYAGWKAALSSRHGIVGEPCVAGRFARDGRADWTHACRPAGRGSNRRADVGGPNGDRVRGAVVGRDWGIHGGPRVQGLRWRMTLGKAADPLLSIGMFSRRSRLSMKALRLYDRRGLLTPADVDPDTGYRRYRESQLAIARLIVMLRRLNMPLAQVAEVVTAPGPVGAELLA